MQVTLDNASWESAEAGTEALVERWLVAEGAQVKAGQPLAEVVLVKATHEVVAPADGVLAKILVPADGTFVQGTPLAEIQARGA
jgi:pyruvate/2-oxoglutarate dehydrogenase complex dihydrolipoamide acyltransferase (E2) component